MTLFSKCEDFSQVFPNKPDTSFQKMQRESSLGYFGMVTFFTFLGWWVHMTRTQVTSEGFLKKVRNWITVCCGNSNSNQKKMTWLEKERQKHVSSIQVSYSSPRQEKNKISEYPGIEAYLVFISPFQKNETCRIIYIIRAKYLTKNKWVPPETWEYHQSGVKETNPEGWQRFATNLTNSRQMSCSWPCSFSSGGGLLYITCLGNGGTSSRCWKGCFISGGKMEPI